jgi:hypothetical protein
MRAVSGNSRTVVTFQSAAFNTTEPKDYFINPCCFGDDVARWLIRKLEGQGIETDAEPGQEDFGWYFNFKLGEEVYCLVLGFREGDEGGEGEWVGWIERTRGLIGSIFGFRKRDISNAAPEAIHEALSNASEIRNVRWHTRNDFDRGNDAAAIESP